MVPIRNIFFNQFHATITTSIRYIHDRLSVTALTEVKLHGTEKTGFFCVKLTAKPIVYWAP